MATNYSVPLVRSFAKNGRNGQKQARKQSVNALAGNSKYNKRHHSHQKVAQQKTMHNSPAGGGISRLNGKLADSGDNFLQPIEIHVCNTASQSEPQSAAPSEESPCGDQSCD